MCAPAEPCSAAPPPGKLAVLPDVTLGLGACDAAASDDSPARFAPAQKAGYLYFCPTQPRRLDEVRVADPEVIPLPPR
jgi:hypothetical protein